MVLLIAIAVPRLFPRTLLPEFENIVPGRVAEETINAGFDFDVAKNPARLQAEQEEAEEGAAPRLRFEPSRADSSIQRAHAFFDELDAVISAVANQSVEEQLDADDARSLLRDEIDEVARESDITSLTDEMIDYLAGAEERDALRNEIASAFDQLRQGVIRGNDLADIASPNVVIREAETGNERVRAAGEIVRLGTFYRAVQDSVGEALPPEGISLFQQLIFQAQPTLRIDQDATRQARELARATVPQFSGVVLAGERIITQNEIVSPDDHLRLLSYQAELIDRGMAGRGTGFLHSLGMVLIVAGVLGIFTYATYRVRRGIYEDLRSLAVLLGVIFLALAAAGAVAATQSSPVLVPIALASLLVAALFDSLLSLVVVTVIIGILIGQPYFAGLATPIVTVAGGVAAAFAARRIRTRAQNWILIVLIFGSYTVAGVCLTLTGHYTVTDLGVTALAGLANATVCTVLAMGALLPLMEVFTGRTTEQSLLELGDMNRPLLRRLSREAPGTYSHSINLANLVEAACEAIGANSLLGRVGVYYHDIGKLERPHFFIENQPKGLNPHDRLTPWQSAEILRDHVRHGLRLAEEARLPEVIRDFIREHHGTQTIQYFLEKARKEGGNLDPSDFTYAGPRPQTRETGIAMLGDAVEAASRLLQNPSPERIRALIDRLVQERIDHGELDDCSLTFRELRIAKREFAHVLTGLYHHRVDYPAPASRREAAGGGDSGRPS